MVLDLLWYFVIFSFLGWLASGIRMMFTDKKFHNMGFFGFALLPVLWILCRGVLPCLEPLCR